jgi:Gpi18-like mannosyltransferase
MLILLLFLALVVRLALAPIIMNRNDRRNFIGASHKTLRYGVASIYEKQRDYEPKRTVRLPYPPVLVYVYAAVGRAYDRLFDPTFKEVAEYLKLPFDSLALSYLIKLPIFLFELVLAAVIFLFVRRRHGEARALACAAFYYLNPAVIYDGALWAQPDAIHSAFLVLAVVFLIEKRPLLCMFFLTLALLSKPQALMAAPLVLVYLLTTNTVRQSLKAILAAVVTGAVLFIPFLVQSASAISDMIQTMSRRDTYVSGNAHNFWWLVSSLSGLDPLMDDSTVALAGVSYAVLSIAILVVVYAGVATVLVKKAYPLTAEPFAYACLLVFVFAVRMHENHGLQILPLLALTGLMLKHQRIVFGALSAVILANMLLYSPEVMGGASDTLVLAAGIVNSGLTVGILAYWSWKLFGQPQSSTGETRSAPPLLFDEAK